MMKIILISPIRSDLGLYTISPLLKAKGHMVNLLFIPSLMENCSRPLSSKTMESINDFIKGVDIIGINGLSENYYKTAIFVDNAKKAIKVPIVWGGIYATLRPQDCIKHADIVCIGEGEESMLELLRKLEKGESIKNTKNLLSHSDWNNGKKPELRAPVDLNSLLPLDYDLASQYIVDNGNIRNVKESDFNGVFYSYSSRGCPFRCSYCCNEVMLNMYKGHKYCRQRNVENIFNELKEIKKRFSSCKKIWFNEADFLSGKTQKEIEDFSKRYKRDINIPFDIWSNPTAINEQNVQILKDAGFSKVNIGTINGNEKIQQYVYNRNVTANLYQSRSEILKKYKIKVEYDVILCNPYENDHDIINTIKLLMQLSKPFRIVIYSLTYFPKTELYKMALKDGIIKEGQHAQSYTKAAYKVWRFRSSSTYLNAVVSMMRGQAKRIDCLGFDLYGILPGFIVKFLIKRPVIKFFEHLPLKSVIYNGIANFIIINYRAFKKISCLTRQFLNFLQRSIWQK